MATYRRNIIPGGTFFFTVALQNRHWDLLTAHIELLRLAFASVRAERPFDIDAIVILPDHLHCLWTLPDGNTDYSIRWRLIKSRFSRKLPDAGNPTRSQIKQCERGIWQRRYWEHTIRDEKDYAAHVDYIHFNPVKHGHAHRVADWPHSSFHRFVRDGILPADWGGDFREDENKRYGE